ncbi:MAG: acyl CoA:acetate/3-ketoacid CoA transferase [Chloroflexota bacterium]
MSKVVSAEQAALALRDGDTLTISGVVGALCPEKVLAAVEARFLAEGQPRGLTVICPVAVGDVWDLPGMDHFANEGMTRRFIAGSYVIGTSPKTGRGPRVVQMVLENKVEGYNFPIGALFNLHRDVAAGRPGHLTEVGLHTFVDPRHGGGKLNRRAEEDLVRLLPVDGQEYLYYKAYPITAAIIRGTTADEDGNLTLEHEGTQSGVLVQALAAHNSGGVVIAQVKRLAARGSLNPQLVRVPGNLVDMVVVDPAQAQATGITYDPAVTGEVRVPPAEVARPLSLTPEKVIGRRALRELRRGETVILGFGVPSMLPSIACEEGSMDQFTFTIEHGAVGGVPLAGFQFGAAANPAAIVDCPTHFDFIAGGGVDLPCLSFAEVGADGSVNVSKLPNMLPGCGGFIDITHRAKRIVFCGTFTAGGYRGAIADGQLVIQQEGRFRKFVRETHHLTLNGAYARQKGQQITYISERGVFVLGDSGPVLMEIAPGMDVERDIAAQMQFPLVVSPNLKPMDPALFAE